VEIDLPAALRNYLLPPPKQTPEGAAEALIRVIDVAPETITLPLFGAVWRSVLGSADFSLFEVGRTGTGKSELAALAQQHLGPAMANEHFPANWASTGNALEAIAFAAKDALLVVDDFSPSGSPSDRARCHRDADRLLRAQGNRAGRARMRSDTTLRPEKHPRGLILSTGEDIPTGHSARARTLILELGPNDMAWERLSACQRDAADGVYAQLMAAFLQWVAGRYDHLQERRRARVSELRSKAYDEVGHRRTPTIVAELAFAWEAFLEFTVETKILSPDAAQSLGNRSWEALGRVSASQAQHHAAADPVNRFLELLASAIASGHAHVAGADGREPANASAWGWRERPIGAGQYAREEWIAQGARVGWLDDDDIYLDQDAAYKAAQDVAGPHGDGISVQVKTLFKRMREHGLLASCDTDRSTIRKTLEGKRRHVAHLHRSALASKSDEEKVSVWPDSGARFSGSRPKIGPENRSTTSEENRNDGPIGPIGPIGPKMAVESTEGDWAEVE
jgi:hypothetical protein